MISKGVLVFLVYETELKLNDPFIIPAPIIKLNKIVIVVISQVSMTACLFKLI